MITGILLLLWGLGIIGLAFYLQTKIQEGVEPEWQQARELYSQIPFIFCMFMFATLALWPLGFIYILFKKGISHGD